MKSDVHASEKPELEGLQGSLWYLTCCFPALCKAQVALQERSSVAFVWVLQMFVKATLCGPDQAAGGG